MGVAVSSDRPVQSNIPRHAWPSLFPPLLVPTAAQSQPGTQGHLVSYVLPKKAKSEHNLIF